MHPIFWLKRILPVAQEIFGRASCTELAEIAILCVLGMIASALVITPGDQSFEAIYSLCAWIMACS